MWEALQTDLVDFVSTIQSDTSKVISSGAEELDDQDRPQDEEQLRAKKVVDLKRSSKTFELPVEKEYVKSFDKFMESFSMSLYNEQISALLDEEVDVARSYAALVPATISPETFYGRYFFRFLSINENLPDSAKIQDGNEAEQDEDDEEENLSWDAADDEAEAVSEAVSVTGDSSKVKGEKEKKTDKESSNNKTAYTQLADENALLKNQIKALVLRVSELEDVIKLSNQERENTHVEMSSVPTKSAEAAAELAESSDKGDGFIFVNKAQVAENQQQQQKQQGAKRHLPPAPVPPSVQANADVPIPIPQVHSLASLENEDDDEGDGWN